MKSAIVFSLLLAGCGTAQLCIGTCEFRSDSEHQSTLNNRPPH